MAVGSTAVVAWAVVDNIVAEALVVDSIAVVASEEDNSHRLHQNHRLGSHRQNHLRRNRHQLERSLVDILLQSRAEGMVVELENLRSGIQAAELEAEQQVAEQLAHVVELDRHPS